MPNSKLRRRLSMSMTALLLLAAQTSSAASMPPQRIQWQKTPITIALSVGEERMVHFPVPVSVGIPATLQSVLRTQTVNGTVYWMAKATFSSTRVMVIGLSRFGLGRSPFIRRNGSWAIGRTQTRL